MIQLQEAERVFIVWSCRRLSDNPFRMIFYILQQTDHTFYVHDRYPSVSEGPLIYILMQHHWFIIVLYWTWELWIRNSCCESGFSLDLLLLSELLFYFILLYHQQHIITAFLYLFFILFIILYIYLTCLITFLQPSKSIYVIANPFLPCFSSYTS